MSINYSQVTSSISRHLTTVVKCLGLVKQNLDSYGKTATLNQLSRHLHNHDTRSQDLFTTKTPADKTSSRSRHSKMCPDQGTVSG